MWWVVERLTNLACDYLNPAKYSLSHHFITETHKSSKQEQTFGKDKNLYRVNYDLHNHLRRRIAVFKIENCWLKYKSKNRIIQNNLTKKFKESVGYKNKVKKY